MIFAPGAVLGEPKATDRLDPRDLANLRGVFTDIDDTISTGGKITPAAFDALWDLHEKGLKLVVVTGRPAGWCDHIARFWPVDAVVGEDGAFYFRYDGSKMQRRYVRDAPRRSEHLRKLHALTEQILREVPGTALAADQAYRECNVAIDYCEDVTPLSQDTSLRIKQLFEQGGATAKISSIHVNGWYGDFDKLSTSRLWAREQLGLDLDEHRGEFAYCGDSPNDEPMFEFFPLSFGMANVRDYLPIMEHHPGFIASRPCGEGFCEVTELVLRSLAPGGGK